MFHFLNVEKLILVCLIGFAFPASAAQAGFKVLYSFTGEKGDCLPAAGVVRDKAGNLYGTTDGEVCNGIGSYGTVYKLAPNGTETVLYTFPGGGSGGCQPDALLMDKKGNLWGTAGACEVGGYGTIFKITPVERESVVHTFQGPPDDGCNPFGGTGW